MADVRSHYENIANTWDKLADERLAFFVGQPDVCRMEDQAVNEHASQAFWAEMSACEHFVQIYEADDVFLDTLTGFIGGGLRQGDGAVVIATPAHRSQLEQRLTAAGVDVNAVKVDDRFVCLDAEETLQQFMANGWPDEDKFAEVVHDILRRVGRNGRRVRAFGEIVALMWAKGHCAATVRLEHLWQRLCENKSFALFCAYPKSGFTENPVDSIARVCAEHSRVLYPG